MESSKTGLATATMDGCKLLCCIVDRKHGERIVSITKEAGATGGTILLGRGTAKSDLMQILGLGDSRKEIVLTLATPDIAQNIKRALQTSEWVSKKVKGILFVIDVFALHRASVLSLARETSMSTLSHELITDIVNAGYAEDIMSVARKAGATGGTILHGRGTAREEDGKFFGLTIVPEKDILLILAGTDKSRDILEAIRTSEFLQQEGLGIAFCSGVEEFVPLGKK